MCLAIPGKVVGTEERSGLRVGRVQFGGIIREASLDFVPEAQVGDYVLARIARGFSFGSGMASVADLSLRRSPKGRTSLQQESNDDRKDQGKNSRYEKGIPFGYPLPSRQWKPDESFDSPVQKTNFWFDRVPPTTHERFLFA